MALAMSAELCIQRNIVCEYVSWTEATRPPEPNYGLLTLVIVVLAGTLIVEGVWRHFFGK